MELQYFNWGEQAAFKNCLLDTTLNALKSVMSDFSNQGWESCCKCKEKGGQSEAEPGSHFTARK